MKVDETFRGHDGKGQRKRPWGLRARLPVWRLRLPVIEVGGIDSGAATATGEGADDALAGAGGW